MGNLERFDLRQERRRNIAEYYDTFMIGSPIQVLEGSANWLYTRFVPDRQTFMKRMKSQNVPVSVVHVGIHRNDIFGNTKDLPVQKLWDEHHVCIPIHSRMGDYDVERVVRAYNSTF